ncbi:MAG TPA: hypothetical protein PLZ32_10370 [Saprospiraceae bacterium]|nr:hypothetical protein [Saprospiraceae bacterium]
METIEQEKQPTLSEIKESQHWLQRLKEESWEAELLVSAIAIYGTFQLFKGINWATNVFIDRLPPSQYLVAYFIVFIGLLAISILASMFVIHFFLRAYWVGLVGLNSVFPDYSLKDSAYSRIYTEKILLVLPKMEQSLKKVDDLCSVIFSAAFTILIMYAYISFSMSIYLFIYNLLVDFIPYYILLIPAFIIIFLAIFQTIFSIVANLKRFKENEKIQTLYFKLVQTTSFLSFGPLYKNIMQVMMTFGSNFKSNKSLIVMLLFFLCSGILVSIYQVNQTNLFYLVRKDYFFDELKTYAGYYHSENENIDFLLSPEINSDIISTQVLKLFIPVFTHEGKKQDAFCGDIERKNGLLKEEELKRLRSERIDCYSKYHQISLNDQAIKTDFLRYVHPKTGQYGIVCYIKMPSGLEGKTILNVKKIFDKDIIYNWSIPFYYMPASK